MATVLVVDDETSIAELLTDFITDIGHTVLVATDGRKALELAEQYHPALIISDIMMPGMDGFDLLRYIRSRSTLASIMIILISAAANEKHIVTDAKTAFLPKPLDFREIERYLQQV